MGVQGANYIVEKIGTEGTVVMLEVPTSGSVSELRKKGFVDTMAEIAPNMTLLTYATKFTREDGLTDIADILTANPQIDAVYSMDDETTIVRSAGDPRSQPHRHQSHHRWRRNAGILQHDARERGYLARIRNLQPRYGSRCR